MYIYLPKLFWDIFSELAETIFVHEYSYEVHQKTGFHNNVTFID